MYSAVIVAAMFAVVSGIPASAELMPVAQQNALVQKYCVVCHTSAELSGGLSLEHFDAAQAPPSLLAMMLSKLTGGVLLKTVREASSNPAATALIDRKMKSGAMGAAGIPVPDKAIIDALIRAWAAESAGATEWTIERSAATLTASIVQEATSGSNKDEAEAYRVIASCNPATHEGKLQVAWAPAPLGGTLAASWDGSAPVRYAGEGSAAAVLAEIKDGSRQGKFALPVESLRIGGRSPDETVSFPFGSLPEKDRAELRACFSGAESANRSASIRDRQRPAEQ